MASVVNQSHTLYDLTTCNFVFIQQPNQQQPVKLKQQLHPVQPAYRSSHSTETVLLHIVNDLLLASDAGKVSLLTLLGLLPLTLLTPPSFSPAWSTYLESTIPPSPSSSPICMTGSKQFLTTTRNPIQSNFPVASLKPVLNFANVCSPT